MNHCNNLLDRRKTHFSVLVRALRKNIVFIVKFELELGCTISACPSGAYIVFISVTDED